MGRKKLENNSKKIKINITITHEQALFLTKFSNSSEFIRSLIDKEIKRELNKMIKSNDLQLNK